MRGALATRATGSASGPGRPRQQDAPQLLGAATHRQDPHPGRCRRCERAGDRGDSRAGGFAFRPYDPWLAHGQSKTAGIRLAITAARRWKPDGITANALMPGASCTNLQRHTGGRGSGRIPAELLKTVEQGAATWVLLATSPDPPTGTGHRTLRDGTRS